MAAKLADTGALNCTAEGRLISRKKYEEGKKVTKGASTILEAMPSAEPLLKCHLIFTSAVLIRELHCPPVRRGLEFSFAGYTLASIGLVFNLFLLYFGLAILGGP